MNLFASVSRCCAVSRCLSAMFQLPCPVYVVQLTSTLDAGEFCIPPNPGLLAFLHRRHQIDLHHRVCWDPLLSNTSFFFFLFFLSKYFYAVTLHTCVNIAYFLKFVVAFCGSKWLTYLQFGCLLCPPPPSPATSNVLLIKPFILFQSTVYIYSDVKHMKMSEKAGVRHIKVDYWDDI